MNTSTIPRRVPLEENETMTAVRRGQIAGAKALVYGSVIGGGFWWWWDRKSWRFRRVPGGPKLMAVFSFAFVWAYMACSWEMRRYRAFMHWKRTGDTDEGREKEIKEAQDWHKQRLKEDAEED